MVECRGIPCYGILKCSPELGTATGCQRSPESAPYDQLVILTVSQRSLTCNVMSSFRPHPGRDEWQPTLRFRSLNVRASENVGPAVRTHRRQRQPYVDGELRLTAQALTRHRLATLRRRRRQMRTQQQPRAHRSATARRIKSSVPAAASRVCPRRPSLPAPGRPWRPAACRTDPGTEQSMVQCRSSRRGLRGGQKACEYCIFTIRRLLRLYLDRAPWCMIRAKRGLNEDLSLRRTTLALPTQRRVLRLFLASPNDVARERSAVSDEVICINRDFPQHTDYTIDLLARIIHEGS